MEYDFSSTDKWEGDGDEMGEEGEMLDYFSTSKKGEETPKVAAKKRKVIAKEKWEVDEAARTGLTVEVHFYLPFFFFFLLFSFPPFPLFLFFFFFNCLYLVPFRKRERSERS